MTDGDDRLEETTIRYNQKLSAKFINVFIFLRNQNRCSDRDISMGEEKEVDSAVVSDEEREMERIRERKMREMEEKAKAMKEGGEKGGEVIDHPMVITDSTFVDAVKKYPLLVVDCWAPWCGPCKMIAPVLEEMAKEYAGRVVFGKLNVDENPRIATEYAIMAIPTLFIFKNGEPVDVIQGALPKPYLEARVKECL